MKDKKIFIAIDIGGTNLRIASFSSVSRPRINELKKFKLSHVFEEDFRRMIELIKRITKEKKISSIGISLPGIVNKNKTTLTKSFFAPEWVGVNLVKTLRNIFGCEVFIENDTVNAALGEFFYEGNNSRDFIFLVWGTGIGGAVLKTKPELSVQKMKPGDFLSDIRSACDGNALSEKYKKLNEINASEWDKITSDFSKLVIHLSKKFGLKNIVLGGGVALRQKKRMALLSKKLKKTDNVNLKLTTLGNHHEFGLYGALALILSKSQPS